MAVGVEQQPEVAVYQHPRLPTPRPRRDDHITVASDRIVLCLCIVHCYLNLPYYPDLYLPYPACLI
jgi:hypothetical protein